MFQFSSDTIFITVVVVGILIVLSTVGSLLTASFMVCMSGRLKETDTRHQNLIRYFQETYSASIDKIRDRLERHANLIRNLYDMMNDASNMELPAAEIAELIQRKIKESGVRVP